VDIINDLFFVADTGDGHLVNAIFKVLDHKSPPAVGMGSRLRAYDNIYKRQLIIEFFGNHFSSDDSFRDYLA
jgi:hypothetical protein